MTDTTERLSLGLINPPQVDDQYLGRVLYLPHRQLLVAPISRTNTMYWCQILADLTRHDSPSHMHLTIEEIAASSDEIALDLTGPLNAEHILIVWLARAAVALRSNQRRWETLRTLVSIARKPLTIDLILDGRTTTSVFNATQRLPQDLKNLLADVEQTHHLLRRLTEGTANRDLGTFRLVGPNLPDFSPAMDVM